MANENKRSALKDVLSKISLRNVGIKPKKIKNSDMCCSMPSIRYPSLYLNTEQLPEMKGKEVNTEVTFLVKGKIISHNLDESTKSKRETFDVEVTQMAIL